MSLFGKRKGGACDAAERLAKINVSSAAGKREVQQSKGA